VAIDMENTVATIRMPEIQIRRQQFWQELEGKYRSKVVIRDGGFNFTEIFFYLAHAENRSSLLHSLVTHLAENREFYAKRYSHELWLIRAATLDGFFGLRECLAGLVNCVFQMEVDCSQTGSAHKITKEAKRRKLAISSYLEQIIEKNSVLDSYLNEFRHPYVHREDLSNFSVQDMTASLIGAEQPRVIRFIDRSIETSQSLQQIEKAIVEECGKQLGLN
jgi:hypothetical protein